MHRPGSFKRQPARHRTPVHGLAELRLLGVVLIAAGLVLLFLCIPGWAWAAMIGAALVVAGYLLISSGCR